MFLDIEMPEKDDFTLADEVCKLDFSVSIVFVTALDKYAIKAFEMNVIDSCSKTIFKEKTRAYNG